MLKKLIAIENGEEFQFDTKEELVRAIIDEKYYEMTKEEQNNILKLKTRKNCAFAIMNNPKYRNTKMEELENKFLLKNETTYILSLLQLGNVVLLERVDANIFAKNIDKTDITDNYIILNYFLQDL